MVSSEDQCPELDIPRVSSNQDISAPAGSAISNLDSEEDDIKVDRDEHDLYPAVELLEEAIKGHHKLRTQILPKLHCHYDQLCDKLQRSSDQIKAVMRRGKEAPKVSRASCDRRRISDSAVPKGQSKSLTTPKEVVALYEDSIEAQIAQFANWYDLWQANLIKEMQSHLEEISRKLKAVVEEAAGMDIEMAFFQGDSLLRQFFAPSALAPGQPGAVHHHPPGEEEPSNYPLGERVNSTDRSRSHYADASSDQISSIRTGNAVEPEILCISVASASPLSAEQPVGNASAASSPKFQQIVAALQHNEQSPTVVNSQQVRSLAAEDVDELWKNVETHPVEMLPVESLGMCMRSLVLLSLVIDDRLLFYKLVLFCAQQLRDPANVDRLMIVTTYRDGVAVPAPNSQIYKLTSQYLLALLPQEKHFFDEVTKLPAQTLVIWCSAYACSLLRLHDRGVGYVRHQLRQLNQQLAEAYGLKEHSLPQIPVDSSSFLGHLRKYTNHTVDEVHRNTLYKGLIECYECAAPPQRTKKLLNFLLLKSLRYRGMSLVTLVDECQKLYGISAKQLVRNTLTDETSASWRNYERFTSTFGKSACKMYKYCEVFQPGAYADLHFDSNFKLCSLLCALIDVRKLKNGCGSSTVLYHRLVKRIRTDSSQRIDATWKQKCVQIVKNFTN